MITFLPLLISSFLFCQSSDNIKNLINFSSDENLTYYSKTSFKKIGSNLIGTIIFGDLNLSYERIYPEKYTDQRSSFISTVHYILNGELKKQDTDFRFSFGSRTYFEILSRIDFFKQKEFVEVKGAINKREGNMIPSFEIGYGISRNLTGQMFYDVKFGLGRSIEKDPIVRPTLSVVLGFNRK